MSTTRTKDFPLSAFVVERASPAQYGSGIAAPPKRDSWTLGGRHTPRQPTMGEILAYLAQPGIALVTYKSGAAVVFRPNGNMVYGDDAPAAVFAAMRADGVAPGVSMPPTPPTPRTERATRIDPLPAAGANDADRPAGVTRPWECERCHQQIPKTRGRPPKVCDACLTPKERETRETQRNAKAATAPTSPTRPECAE